MKALVAQMIPPPTLLALQAAAIFLGAYMGFHKFDPMPGPWTLLPHGGRRSKGGDERHQQPGEPQQHPLHADAPVTSTVTSTWSNLEKGA
jgi:hypothetical protein